MRVNVIVQCPDEHENGKNNEPEMAFTSIRKFSRVESFSISMSTGPRLVRKMTYKKDDEAYNMHSIGIKDLGGIEYSVVSSSLIVTASPSSIMSIAPALTHVNAAIKIENSFLLNIVFGFLQSSSLLRRLTNKKPLQ